MKKLSIVALLALITITTYGQEQESYNTEKVFRVNFLNPGAELELPTGNYSTFSTGLGIGYGGGYKDLTGTDNGVITAIDNGIIYIIAPFLDLQQKWFYNLNKRIGKNKTVQNNSGNFISARFITRGPSIADNVTRTSDFDFAFGPTWGIQRKYGEKFHLLFDVGPQYYFDTEGNGNIFPFMFQLNLGFDL
ncbi:hypothetical protein ML462_15620 [Gramella lutea]|uniref:Outer membrane protein beta-barrel domain-containing protein n=1 Tax=Christiangramia lutea TaxID=1607951 RepID=A0A9X1V548_9FLAO|nr:hypothetical protein [Christiangramia lutea]MCH4824602.1 hypothetical protein [Christiangramia lutea]